MVLLLIVAFDAATEPDDLGRRVNASVSKQESDLRELFAAAHYTLRNSATKYSFETNEPQSCEFI